MRIGDKDLYYFTGKDLKFAVVCDNAKQAEAFSELFLTPNSKVVFTFNEDLALKINELYQDEMKIRHTELIKTLNEMEDFKDVSKTQFELYFEMTYDASKYIKNTVERYERVIKNLKKYKGVLKCH